VLFYLHTNNDNDFYFISFDYVPYYIMILLYAVANEIEK